MVGNKLPGKAVETSEEMPGLEGQEGLCRAPVRGVWGVRLKHCRQTDLLEEAWKWIRAQYGNSGMSTRC